MTDLLQRFVPALPSAGDPRYRSVLTAAGAGLWALAVGLAGSVALALVGWLVDDTGVGAASAAQVGLQAFLIAHGGGLQTAWGTIGLIPLGLTLVFGWLLLRAGAAVARRRELSGRGEIVEAVAALALVYAVLTTMLTPLAGSSAVSVSAWRAGLGAGALALVAASVGVLRVTGPGLLPWHRVPGPRRPLAAAVAAGLLTLVAGGAVVLAVALALDTGRYAELSRAVAPSGSGAVALTLLGVVLLPNAVVYAVAAGIGPGFSIGSGTVVGTFGVHLDVVPALPLLAALPDGGSPPYAAAVVPLAAGLVVGLVLVRRLDPEDDRGPWSTAGWAALGGVLVAVVLGAAAYLAGGPLGNGQLATVGPSGLSVAGWAAAELALVAAGTAVVLRHRATRT